MNRQAGVPACWSWPVTEKEHERAYQVASGTYHADVLLTEWQAGWCAACGSARSPLEADHNHTTGYLRGLLCHSCNVREAHAPEGEPLFSRYRCRCPAAILGITLAWAIPDSAAAALATLGPDPAEALKRHQEATDPARRR